MERRANDGRYPRSSHRRIRKSGKSKKEVMKAKRAERRAARTSPPASSSRSGGAAAPLAADAGSDDGETSAAQPLSDDAVRSMLVARAEARFARDFAAADAIRDEVRASGLRFDWTRIDSLATRGEDGRADGEELYQLAHAPPAARVAHCSLWQKPKKKKNNGKYVQRCHAFEESATCEYGDACRFAHTKEARQRAAARAVAATPGGRAAAWVCFCCKRSGADTAFACRQEALHSALRQCKACANAAHAAAMAESEAELLRVVEESEEAVGEGDSDGDGGGHGGDEGDTHTPPRFADDPRTWRGAEIAHFVRELGLSPAQAESVARAAPNGCHFLSLTGTKLKRVEEFGGGVPGARGAALAADRRRLKDAIAALLAQVVA